MMKIFIDSSVIIEFQKQNAKAVLLLENQKLSDNVIYINSIVVSIEDISLNQSIEKIFTQVGCSEMPLLLGKYNYFDVNSVGKRITRHYNPYNYFIKDFTFHFDGNIETLKTTIQSFKENYNKNNPENDMNIYFQNSMEIEKLNFEIVMVR